MTHEIEAALAHAQAAGDIVLVHGASGAGKTWAARRYCDTRAGAAYLQATCAVRTISALLSHVSRALEAYVRVQSATALEAAVIEHLRGRGALLVIDEAHHLPARLLDELRCIRDIAGCGLALVASDEIRMTLARCPQIVGRISIRLARPAAADADIETVVRGALGREPGRRELAAAMAAAAAPGGMHALRRMLERAWVCARAAGRPAVTAEDVAAAAAGAAPARIAAGRRREAA